MNNKSLRPKGGFRIERAESYGWEAGDDNEREEVSYRRAVSTMGFMIGAILQVIISAMKNSFQSNRDILRGLEVP